MNYRHKNDKNKSWSLMSSNISGDDVDAVVSFLSQKEIPILTQSKKVREFEEAWSKWLGITYSVFVNSGSSADHVHHFGWYIGNYPDLDPAQIPRLCTLLNSL